MFWDVLRGFVRHVLPVSFKGAAFFLGSLMKKRVEGQNCRNAATESIRPAAVTVLNEASHREKKGGSGKKKMQKMRRSKVYKAPSTSNRRKHSEYRSRL